MNVEPLVHAGPSKPAPTTTKSCAQAVSSLIAPVFSTPKRKGDYIAIKVNPISYDKYLKLCNRSLIRQVFLSKGEAPWKLPTLRENLQYIWRLSSLWRLVSLGQDFYQILLHLRSLGVPLKFDEMTLKEDYGHFTRMLIDVDLSKP